MCTTAELNNTGEMLTTSMFRPKLVARVRDETFTSLVGEMADAKPEQLKTFHWHAGDDGVTSIRMSRPDACTHSISEVSVSMVKEVAQFQYSPQDGIRGVEQVPPSTSMFLPLTK